MFSIKKYFSVLFLPTIIYSCSKNPVRSNDTFVLVVPDGFALPGIPGDNTLTNSRVELGKKLFYDPILSGNYSTSCASCHRQQFAFADNKKLSVGADGKEGKTNTPSLANVAYIDNLMKEGGVHTLEIQVVAPVEEHVEMNLDVNDAVKRLQQNPVYVWLSYKAYGRKPDHFVLTRALSAFQRILISGNSRYDQSIHNGLLLSAEEKRGQDLFFSDSLSCSSCHSGFLFTNQSFQNNGLYEKYITNGRERITHDSTDIGKFRVPSLRNISVTAPYMHDGSIATLEEVISHYASGGKNHPNKSEKIQGFGLKEEDRQALKAFLTTLTDEEFLKNRNFSIEK